MKKILKSVQEFLRLYVIVYGLTIMATVLFLYVFRNEGVSRKFLVNAMLFSFTALLPVVVDFTLQQDFIDSHYLLLQAGTLIFNEATLMPLGYKIGMWNSVRSGILMAVIILAVNLLTPLIAYGQDISLSSRINKKLQQLNDEASTHDVEN